MSDAFQIASTLTCVLLAAAAVNCAGSDMPIQGLPDQCETAQEPPWNPDRTLLEYACPPGDVSCQIVAVELSMALFRFDEDPLRGTVESYRLVHDSKQGAVLVSAEMAPVGPIAKLKLTSPVEKCGGYYTWKCERRIALAEWNAVKRASVNSRFWREKYRLGGIHERDSFLTIEAAGDGNYRFAFGEPIRLMAVAPVAAALLNAGSCGGIAPAKIIANEFP